METLIEAPKPTSFIPLIEHQSSTPASFYTGPPVLHYYSECSRLIVLGHEAQSIPALAPLLSLSTSQTQAEQFPETNGTSTNGDGTGATGKQKVIENLDVWVTSDKLLLFSPSANAGLSIPYPSISLHAIQTLPQPSAREQQGLYMQIISQPSALAAGEAEEPDTISLTVIPTASGPPQGAPQSGTTEEGLEGEESPEQTPVMAMFNALSACSNLHPDPVEQGDEDRDGGASRLFRAGLALPGAQDGGLPPPMPGSGGWITAENMHEFFDEEGNWIGGDEVEEGEDEIEDDGLGPGAGTVRVREDDEQGNGDAVEGDGTDETKWRRTR